MYIYIHTCKFTGKIHSTYEQQVLPEGHKLYVRQTILRLYCSFIAVQPVTMINT